MTPSVVVRTSLALTLAVCAGATHAPPQGKAGEAKVTGPPGGLRGWGAHALVLQPPPLIGTVAPLAVVHVLPPTVAPPTPTPIHAVACLTDKECTVPHTSCYHTPPVLGLPP